jgi:uncharacterized protein
MILKILLVIVVITTVYFLFIKKKPNQVKEKKETKKQTPKANDMIECASCGIYCEVDDMILSNAKYYCSKECVDKG